MAKFVRINSLLRRLALPDRSEHAAESDHNVVDDNIDTILASYRRVEHKINRPQRSIERLSDLVGSPAYLAALLATVTTWLCANAIAANVYGRLLDPPPYFWLQGGITFAALLTSTVVLIKQNRMSRIEAQRAHLALQINLLTEQKVTKLIALLEELRRDLPMVKDRDDPAAAALQQPADPDAMMVTIEEWRSETDPGFAIDEGRVRQP